MENSKNENKLLNFQQARFVFDNMTEEVHFWEILRREYGDIKTWRLIYANKSALKTWGYSSLNDIMHKTTDELFGEGATKHYMPIVEKIMKEGCPHSFQDYFPNINRHFRFTSVPLGEFFITTGWDISDFVLRNKALTIDKENLQKQVLFNLELEQEVQKRTAEMEQSNRQLAENISKLRLELELRDDHNRKNTNKIVELLLKQSDLVQANSNILRALNSARKENQQLREKLRGI